MKKRQHTSSFKRKAVSFAVSALLVGGVVGSANVASAAQHGAPEVSIADTGSLLIGPYYTVTDGKTTTFGITNTSGNAVATKIRFRSRERSIDVFDITVILSPYDQIAVYLTLDKDTQRPVFNISRNMVDNGPGTQDATPGDVDDVDDTCRVPVTGDKGTGSYLFSDRSGVSPQGMQEGHIEVIAMAQFQNAPLGDPTAPWLGDFATHQNPAMDCTFFAQMFGSRTALETVKTTRGQQILDAGDPLRGTFAINDNQDGYQAAGEMQAISGFNPDGAGGDTLFAHSVEPVQGGPVFPDQSDDLEEEHPHIGDYAGYQGVDTVLGSPVIANDWSVNQGNSVALEWVINFPTKYAHMAQTLPGGKPGAEILPWVAKGRKVCLWNRNVAVFDREEKKGGVTVSPGPRLNLCDETNVIQWTPVGVTPPDVLDSYGNTLVEVTGLKNSFGWAMLGLTEVPTVRPMSPQVQSENTKPAPIAAQVGFAINTRDVGRLGGDKRQGSIVPHSRISRTLFPEAGAPGALPVSVD